MKKLCFILFLMVILNTLISCFNVNTKTDFPEAQTSTTTDNSTSMSSKDDVVKGVWWWNNKLDDSYLDFAYENNINEIYYCDSRFNEDTNEFIKKANSKEIKVYFLTGDYSWLNDDSGLIEVINKYIQYQNTHKYIFAGIHLDIEPHQDPSFNTNRNLLLTKLALLVVDLNNNYPNISFDYDIPFWIEDEITVLNETKPVYQFILDNANRVFIMSYRDSFDAILNVSANELDYSLKHKNNLVLSVETYSQEGDMVSFYEEGKAFLNEVIEQLFVSINEKNGACGISIHQIATWYDLKE